MNVEQAIKALHELKIKDKMSDTQREQLRILLSGVLSTPEGLAAVREQLTPTIVFNRKITQSLIEEIQRRLEQSGVERRDTLLRLLTYIAHGDKIDSASLWLAISVYLKLGPSEAPRLLAEVLETIPQKDLEERYEKYGYPFLNPDGGLPSLLALAMDVGIRPYPWLSGLIERVANRVWKSGQIADFTLQHVQTYLTRLVQTSPIRFMRADRPLILLALAHMERTEGLRDLLESLLRALPEPDPNDHAQRDWRPIIAQRVRERLEDKPSPLPPPVVLPMRPAPEPAPVIEAMEADPPDPVSDRPVSPPPPPRVAPPVFAPSILQRSERAALRPTPPESNPGEVDLHVQQILQSVDKLRLLGKEYTQMKDTIRSLEEQLADTRSTIEGLEATLKERDRKLIMVQAKLSATQEQYLMASRQIERLQKQYDHVERENEPVMEPHINEES